MLKTTEIITTKSFRLAIYKKGKVQSNKLALILPGKLDTKDYPHMRSHVEFLSTQGYLAISFDPPGTWESEGDISIYTTANYLKAIQEIIEYYGNKQTFVMGHSRGGSIAILAGARLKQVERFAAIMSPTTYKNKKILKKEKEFITSVRDTPKWYKERTKTFNIPYSCFEKSLKYDMIDDLKTCKKPKVFIAGSKDKLIDPIKIKKAYELSSEPKQFEIIESFHNYRKDEKMIQKINQIIGKFILK